MWPRGDKLEGHLNTDDALQLIKATKPKCAVTTHYGFKLLNVDPVKEASWLSDESGIPVISARDGMKVTLTEEITVQGPRKTDEPLYLRV
jgi:hypothetical protein